jgi:hypothetical protein
MQQQMISSLLRWCNKLIQYATTTPQRSSNVLLFDGYKSKLADFNLTSQPPDGAARLHSTRVLGTFGYHAPE